MKREAYGLAHQPLKTVSRSAVEALLFRLRPEAFEGLGAKLGPVSAPFGPYGEHFIIFGNLEHRTPRFLIPHMPRKRPNFLGSGEPMFRVIQQVLMLHNAKLDEGNHVSQSKSEGVANICSRLLP
jgi:hypothetical protein